MWKEYDFYFKGLANKAIENIITCKKDRANLLSNLILSEQPNADSLWRVNMQNYLAHPDHQMILPNQDGQNGNGSSKFEGKALFIRYIHTYKKFSMSQIFLVDFEFHDFFFI